MMLSRRWNTLDQANWEAGNEIGREAGYMRAVCDMIRCDRRAAKRLIAKAEAEGFHDLARAIESELGD